MDKLLQPGMEESDIILQQSKAWIKKFVLEMGLCPFAKPIWDARLIYFQLSQAEAPDKIIEDVFLLCEKVVNVSPEEIETAILILPKALSDFEAYLDMLDTLNELLEEAELEGVLQIASFHPHYQFDGTGEHSPENFTNRSPYPMFHILREESVSAAIENFPNVDDIPQKNIEKMEGLGISKIRELLKMIMENPQEVLGS
ncbi:MAG: DUF1415 domain-containing protein [Bacteroidota bacterium]